MAVFHPVPDPDGVPPTQDPEDVSDGIAWVVELTALEPVPPTPSDARGQLRVRVLEEQNLLEWFLAHDVANPTHPTNTPADSAS